MAALAEDNNKPKYEQGDIVQVKDQWFPGRILQRGDRQSGSPSTWETLVKYEVAGKKMEPEKVSNKRIRKLIPADMDWEKQVPVERDVVRKLETKQHSVNIGKLPVGTEIEVQAPASEMWYPGVVLGVADDVVSVQFMQGLDLKYRLKNVADIRKLNIPYLALPAKLLEPPVLKSEQPEEKSCPFKYKKMKTPENPGYSPNQLDIKRLEVTEIKQVAKARGKQLWEDIRCDTPIYFKHNDKWYEGTIRSLPNKKDKEPSFWVTYTNEWGVMGAVPIPLRKFAKQFTFKYSRSGPLGDIDEGHEAQPSEASLIAENQLFADEYYLESAEFDDAYDSEYFGEIQFDGAYDGEYGYYGNYDDANAHDEWAQVGSSHIAPPSYVAQGIEYGRIKIYDELMLGSVVAALLLVVLCALCCVGGLALVTYVGWKRLERTKRVKGRKPEEPLSDNDSV